MAYKPKLHDAHNKPIALNGEPIDARSMYYTDKPDHVYRPYNGTAEVAAYLPAARNKRGLFDIYVNVGGTLNPDHSFTGGIITVYWYVNGTLTMKGGNVSQGQIDQLISQLTAAVTDLQAQINLKAFKGSLDQEIFDRQAADSGLSQALNSETQARQLADTNINSALAGKASTGSLDAEAQARQSADAVLQQSLLSEAQQRQAADSVLDQKIDLEAAQRGQSDVELTVLINGKASTASVTAEAQARQATDALLSQEIEEETVRAQEAEASILGNVSLNSVKTSSRRGTAGQSAITFPELVNQTPIVWYRGLTPLHPGAVTFNPTTGVVTLDFALELNEQVYAVYSGTGGTNVDFTKYAPTNGGTDTPPFFNNDSETLIINDLSTFSAVNPYPGDKFILTPAKTSYGVISGVGYVSSFKIKVVNGEVGRKVTFLILEKDTNLVKFKSDAIACEAAGFFEWFVPDTTLSDVSQGDRVAVMLDAVNAAANGLAAVTTTPGSDLFEYHNGNVTIPDEGQVLAVDGSYNSFRFCFSAAVILNPSEEKPVVRYQQLDKPGAPATIKRSTGKIDPKWLAYNLNPAKDKTILVVGNSFDFTPDQEGKTISQNMAEMLECNVNNQAVPSSAMWFIPATQAAKLNLTGKITELNAIQANAGLLSYEVRVMPFLPDTDVVVICHFINDAMKFLTNPGTIDSLDRSTILGAWNYLIQEIYAAKPSQRIIICTQCVRFDNLSNPGNPFDIARIDAGRALIKQIAEKYNLPFYDEAITSQFNNFTKAVNTSDTLHPAAVMIPKLAINRSNFIKNNW